MYDTNDTIAAPATPAGGAIALIRVSGPKALEICDRLFRGRSLLASAAPNTVHYGGIFDGERMVDEVLVSVFCAPRSYTGENAAEISCHGSRYIIAEILRLLLMAGARLAQPGEFTTRAFLAGKMDLAQAEAVADLIASSSRTAHALASTQMRGGFSAELAGLRARLVSLASLLELELDFSEEDVQFADRGELRRTMREIQSQIDSLRRSFSLGNALKQGVAVAIAGAPNVGKSTLLNRLLGEERALVSEIAGTTRDAIEETIDIDGVLFRFIDTAGIRTTDDRIERMGIERTLAAVERAQIVIHLMDATNGMPGQSVSTTSPIPSRHTIAGQSPAVERLSVRSDQCLIEVVNKIDSAPRIDIPCHAIAISAREGTGIDHLRDTLRNAVDTAAIDHGDTVVTSARHFEALASAHDSLTQALSALDCDLSSDLLSEEIRTTLHHLGTITGVITNDEILGTIFSKFCIGK